MTDLEATRLCAGAMGLSTKPAHGGAFEYATWHGPEGEHPTYHIYAPLHDDAQCMALVKRFHVHLFQDGPDVEWEVSIGVDQPIAEFYAPDLNRAVVYCVAKMQAAKK